MAHRIIAALMLLSMPAQASDTTLATKAWGDNRPADRSISITALATEAKDGLNLIVTAYDKASPVQTIAITSGVKIIATCTDGWSCMAFWPKTGMSATNDVLLTATNAAGAKFTMPLRLSRP